jgi:RNA polymerase sigma-70 factor (ECF subfamily)
MMPIENIVEEYGIKIRSLAMKVTKCPADAEEVYQDALMRVYENQASFKGDSKFSSWVYQVAYNEALGKLRKRKAGIQKSTCSLNELDGGIENMFASNDDTYKNLELRQLLQKAISRLPEEYRESFLLHDVHGMNSDEVAAKLSLTKATVKTRLRRARLQLRNLLVHANK